MSKIPMDEKRLAQIEARYRKNWETTEGPAQAPVPSSFLVAACEDVPDLIGEVRRLRQLYEAGRSAFNEASEKQEARINELQTERDNLKNHVQTLRSEQAHAVKHCPTGEPGTQGFQGPPRPMSDYRLSAIESNTDPLNNDVLALIREIKRLKKANEESYEEGRLVFEDKHALIERLRTYNENLKAEVDKLKSEEDGRLKYVSHAVGQVLKAEEERDEALAVIGSPGYSPNCMACSELRNRGASGSAGAMKARALQDARLKVVETAKKIRAINKEYDPDALSHKIASKQFEEALNALETLEAPPKPAPVDASVIMSREDLDKMGTRTVLMTPERLALEAAQGQIAKQANMMATLMKEVLRLGSELSAAQKKAKEGKETT